MARETNGEFVGRLMDFGVNETGAITQVFVLEAMRVYGLAVLADKTQDEDGALLAPGLWRRAAEGVLAELGRRGYHDTGGIGQGVFREVYGDEVGSGDAPVAGG